MFRVNCKRIQGIMSDSTEKVGERNLLRSYYQALRQDIISQLLMALVAQYEKGAEIQKFLAAC